MSERAARDPGAAAERRHRAVRRLALGRLERCRRTGAGRALQDFHARYKYQLMASGPARARTLGRIAARAAGEAAAQAYEDYARELTAALASPPAPGGHENALLHMFGYVSNARSPAERDGFLAALAAFRAGTGPLAAPVALLWEWIGAQDVAYLKPQSYFESFLRAR